MISKKWAKQFKHGHPKFYDILEELAQLHNIKNRDYASRETPLENFERVGYILEAYNIFTPNHRALKTCLAYMQKQWDAVFKLVGKNQVGQVEGIRDRLKDIAVYAIIAMILDEEEK